MPGACPRGPPGKELVLKPRQSRPTRAAPPHRPRFDVTPLGVRIGAQVRGLALDDAPRGDTLNALEDLLETWGVLVFPGQQITPAQQVAFSRAFGELETAGTGEARLDGQPEIFVIANTDARPGLAPPEALFWHADHQCCTEPARASLLYCRQTPPVGGDTVFACMYSAYEALPPTDKAEAQRLIALHAVAAPDATGDGTADDPAGPLILRCPLVRHHPRSGRMALWFGSQTTIGIEGWEAERAREYLARLEAHATRAAFLYRHGWKPGDAVLWDNRRVLHAGTGFDGARHLREMHRTTIRETGPIR